MPEVSVIIPIYNTAAYLRKALDSICGQTLKELEIILIDDGSTDGSRGIIEEYAERDARIRWYAQPNQGLSVARNRGLLHATGKYIYFMDSDDILDTQALRHCHDLCEKRELDFIFFDAKPLTESADSQNIPNYDRKGKIDESVHSGMELLDYELSNRLFLTPVYLCMVNRLFLKRYTTVCTQMQALGQEHPEWKTVIRKYLSYTLNDVIWAGHRMSLLEKIETACRFRRLRLGKYVSFRNWAVFWLKKK